jgi:hypothetical protein
MYICYNLPIKKNYSEKILKQAFACPDEDEMRVAMALANKLDWNILFLSPNPYGGRHTPDIEVNGSARWEIKTLRQNGKYTVQHAYTAALRQSNNVIFNLHKLKIPEGSAISKIKNYFFASNKTKRLKIITKSGDILDFSK